MKKAKITSTQISSISGSLEKSLRENAKSLPREATQAVLDHELNALQRDLCEAVCSRVKRRGEMIVRTVVVNRDLPPSKLAGHFPRYQPFSGYERRIDTQVMDTMPRLGTGKETVTLFFFKPESGLTSHYGYISVLRDCGLEPDYYAQIQANLDDPLLAKEHPNCAILGKEETSGRYPNGYPRTWIPYMNLSHGPTSSRNDYDVDRWKLILRCGWTEMTKYSSFHNYIAGRLPRTP